MMLSFRTLTWAEVGNIGYELLDLESWINMTCRQIPLDCMLFLNLFVLWNVSFLHNLRIIAQTPDSQDYGSQDEKEEHSLLRNTGRFI